MAHINLSMLKMCLSLPHTRSIFRIVAYLLQVRPNIAPIVADEVNFM